MSHARVKPEGWPVNGSGSDALTSAQMNQLDINISECVDKTTAGDTVSGVLTFADGAGTTFESGSALVQNAGATAALSGVTTVIGAGAKIATAASGRLELADSDYPQLAAGHTGRTHVRYHSLAELIQMGGSTPDAAGLTLSANTTAEFALPVHHGSTLVSVEIRFQPAIIHTALPDRSVRLTVKRLAFPVGTLGSSIAPAYLLAAQNVDYAIPASVDDYNAVALRSLTLTCDQNNVIDRTLYGYSFAVSGETGTGALPVNITAVVTTSTVTDLRVG